MDIPQLEPESKPSVFKICSFDGADQLTHPWMCQTEFGIREFAHWDQAIDYALSLNPKPKPAHDFNRGFSVGDAVLYWHVRLGAFVAGEIVYLDNKGIAVVMDDGFESLVYTTSLTRPDYDS